MPRLLVLICFGKQVERGMDEDGGVNGKRCPFHHVARDDLLISHDARLSSREPNGGLSLLIGEK